MKAQADLPLDFEQLIEERVPVAEDDSGKIETLADGSISIPLYEEELVVTKRTVLRERIIIRKQVAMRTQRVTAELRREQVEIDADKDVELIDESRAEENDADGQPGGEQVSS